MMNSLELGGDGRTVSLGFSLAPEAIDALAALRGQRSRPEPSPEPNVAPAPAPPVTPRT